MRLLNIRLGSPTNHSSAHMLLVSDDLPEHKERSYSDSADGWYYGSERFVLREYDSKLRYLAKQLYSSLQNDVGSGMAGLVVMSLLGVNVPSESYVDG